MREILFRGKRTDNGEWIEGMLFNGKEDTFIIPHGNEYSYDEQEGLSFDVYGCKVDPETVGQYTGLTDTNGNKIFENDVVKCNDEIINAEFTAFVKFGNPNGEYNWGYRLNFIAGDTANLDILLWVEMEEESAYIEVIGNIHDNPERLEVKDEI